MRKTVIAIICIGLLVFAVIGAIVIIKSAPKAEKKAPAKMAPRVEIQPLESSDEIVVLYLTGTVVPTEEVMLHARVSGEIISRSPQFIEGGLLEKGANVLTLDPVDYELALASSQASLATARFNHKMELGRQDVAHREWELLKTDNASDQEKELALRIPHLAASQASLQAAEALLEKAQIDLSRTKIQAPFNAVVLGREVNVGSQASPSIPLAQLAGTDTYWIKVSIAIDRLPWLEIPGASVQVFSSSGAIREGRVIKLLGDIEAMGRMARILVEVEDPLCLEPERKGGKPLLLGEYVRTEIQGIELEGVYRIPRNALRENNEVWLARNGTLEIRPAEVLWRGTRHVLIRAPLNKGGDEGDTLIISDMATPIQGLDVNAENKSSPKK